MDSQLPLTELQQKMINDELQKEQKEVKIWNYRKLLLPTLLYACFYTFFLYENPGSITMPFFVALILGYVYYCMKQMKINVKSDSWFYAIVMLLLGISDMLTGNSMIIFFNNAGIMLLLICLLLHNFYDDSKWNLGKYFSALFQAIGGAISCITEPLTDMASYFERNREKGKKEGKGVYVVIGVGISIPFLTVIVLLLSSADAVFASFLRNNFQFDYNFGTAFKIVFTFLFGFFSAYCGIRYLGKRKISESCKEYKKWEPVIAITLLLLTSVVYVLFSGIQIVYLFAGQMELPEGYTYAAYAREGFFQLLFVCMINLVLVLAVINHFDRSHLLKGLLTLISVCTYIMIASSAYRMILYVRNYNLTFLRILVLWTLAVLAVLLAGIMVQIYKKDFPLFRYGMTAVCIGYLLLSFSHPDFIIAKYNLTQIENGTCQTVDYNYLMYLSSDAAPAIFSEDTVFGSNAVEAAAADKLQIEHNNWKKRYADYVTANMSDSVRKFNVSKAYAKKLIYERFYLSME